MSYVCGICGGDQIVVTVQDSIDPNTLESVPVERRGPAAQPSKAAWCSTCNNEVDMSEQLDVRDVVLTIRQLGPKFENFHLTPCGGCGCPMWQQPCLICGFYPYGSKVTGAAAQSNRPSQLNNEPWVCSKEEWTKAVNGRGGIVQFYLSCYHKCVDPQHDKLNVALRKAEDYIWPSADVIWDHARKAYLKMLNTSGWQLRENILCDAGLTGRFSKDA